MQTLILIALMGTSLSSLAHDSKGEFCLRLLQGGATAPYVSANRRQMAIGIELMKIKPAPLRGTPVAMNVTSELQELSRANLERLLSQLPAPRIFSSKVEELLTGLTFVPLAPLKQEAAGPFLPTNDFYSLLTDGTATATVKLSPAAATAPVRPSSFIGQLHEDSIRADPDFVARHGFAIPGFEDAVDLLNFFDKWDPDAIDELVRFNRYSLPDQVQTAQQFREYLKTQNLYSLFPAATLRLRMTPLRERLHRFVLTGPDSEVFFRRLIELYISVAVEHGHKSMAEIERTLQMNGGSGFYFLAALKAVGWAPEIRVPIDLPTASYGVLRLYEVRPMLPKAYTGRKDTRRLDHKDRP